MRFDVFSEFGCPSDREIARYIEDVIQKALFQGRNPNEIPGTFVKKYCSGSTMLKYLQAKHLQVRIN